MHLHPDNLREKLEPLFRENFERFGELGAAVSVWQHGKPVLDLQGGFRDARREQPWTDDTLVLIWSATKGIGAACVLHVLQEHEIDLAQPVVEFWPEFGAGGKEKITLRQLLSHQAGLCALDEPADIIDYASVIHALEQQTPLWPPGTAHGYHARTFGFLLDEIVRRIAGQSLSQYWQKHFADPLGLDIWVGLPAEQNDRVATTYAAKIGKGVEQMRSSGSEKFYDALATTGSFARKVFSSPRGLSAVSAMNDPQNRARELVSLGGIATASSLGKFYAMLAAGGHWEAREFFSKKTMAWMTTTLSDGIDRVFGFPTAFSAGFMKDATDSAPKLFGGSDIAFGHPGAGGSHAFADPAAGIAFAYVMNQMSQSVLPNHKSLHLVQAIYADD